MISTLLSVFCEYCITVASGRPAAACVCISLARIGHMLGDLQGLFLTFAIVFLTYLLVVLRCFHKMKRNEHLVNF